jgi:hypothetical protein
MFLPAPPPFVWSISLFGTLLATSSTISLRDWCAGSPFYTHELNSWQGLTFNTPMSDELYNRHVRFSTIEGGIWGEAVRIVSGLRRDATAAVLTPQFNGQATPDISTWPTTVSSEIDQLPIWSDFTLDQLSSERFEIKKRTNAGDAASWIDWAGFGKRASGVGYIGGANGGGALFAFRGMLENYVAKTVLIFVLLDFWQGAPRGLDIRNAGSDTAAVTLWAYSPRVSTESVLCVINLQCFRRERWT